MRLFRRISRKKLIVISAISLVVIAGGITVPLVFLRGNKVLTCGGICSPIGNEAVDTSAMYTNDGNSFGKNVGSILHELNTPETLSPPDPFWAVFARCGDHHFTCNNPNGAVYIAPFNCLNSNNQPVVNLDFDPKDHDCQGMLLLEPSFYYNNQGKFIGTSCLFFVYSKSYSLPPIVIFGTTFQGAGEWNGFFNLPGKHGCSTGVKAKIIWAFRP